MGMFGRASAALGQWSKAHMGMIPDPSPATAGALVDALGGAADMVNQYVANPALNAVGSSFRFPTGAVQDAVAQPKTMMGRAGRMALGMAIPVPGAQEAGGARAVEEAAQAVRDLKWGPTAGERLVRAQRVLGMHGGVHPEALDVAHQAADELGMPRIDASQTVATPAPALTGDSVLNQPRGMIGRQGLTALAPTTDAGLAIRGKPFAKGMEQASAAVSKMSSDAGPIDLSRPSSVQFPQIKTPRADPPRGISQRMQDAMANPAVNEGLTQSMTDGRNLGIETWYHNDPVYEAWVNTLGQDEGHKAYNEFMDLQSASSNRSTVPENIRNGSYYYVKGPAAATEPLPYPYGHLAQGNHKSNALQVWQNGGIDPVANPKPHAYGGALKGNLQDVAVDTHAFRNIGMRTDDPRFLETSISDDIKLDKDGTPQLPGAGTLGDRYGEIMQGKKGPKLVFRPQQLVQSGKLSMDEAKAIPSFWAAQPNPNEYAAAEKLYTERGADMGMQPADAQATAWGGAGDLTGLGTDANKTWRQMFNDRVNYTALMRGEDPKDTLDMLIRKQKPLLSLGAGVGAGGLAYGASQDQGGQERY